MLPTASAPHLGKVIVCVAGVLSGELQQHHAHCSAKTSLGKGLLCVVSWVSGHPFPTPPSMHSLTHSPWLSHWGRSTCHWRMLCLHGSSRHRPAGRHRAQNQPRRTWPQWARWRCCRHEQGGSREWRVCVRAVRFSAAYVSHWRSGRSSESPDMYTIGVWVWQLTRPGSKTCWPRSSCS